MRSGSDNMNYFSENKLTKLANFVQFIRRPMLMYRRIIYILYTYDLQQFCSISDCRKV